MESRNFDRFSSAFTQSYNRRDALRVLGLGAIGAGSASVLAPVSGDARRRTSIKQTQPTPPAACSRGT